MGRLKSEISARREYLNEITSGYFQGGRWSILPFPHLVSSRRTVIVDKLLPRLCWSDNQYQGLKQLNNLATAVKSGDLQGLDYNAFVDLSQELAAKLGPLLVAHNFRSSLRAWEFRFTPLFNHKQLEQAATYFAAVGEDYWRHVCTGCYCYIEGKPTKNSVSLNDDQKLQLIEGKAIKLTGEWQLPLKDGMVCYLNIYNDSVSIAADSELNL